MEPILQAVKNARAIEIFTTGWCNLDCNYCYIPKSDAMKQIHKEIMQKIDSGEYIDDLKKIYTPDKLESISLWGTEPTLSLPKVMKMIPDIAEYFPNFKKITFSSNMMHNAPDILMNAIMTLPTDRKWNFRVQVSVDGPVEISDVNRAEGAAEKIQHNVVKFIDLLNNNKYKTKHVRVDCISKATWTMDNIKWMSQGRDNLYKYYEYFDDTYGLMVKANNHNACGINNWSTPYGSLAVPGKYTQKDGFIYSDLTKLILDFERENEKNKIFKNLKSTSHLYEVRNRRMFKSRFDDGSLGHIDSQNTSCSAGKSNFALGDEGELHLCHRSFYLNKEIYLNELRKTDDLENWDVSNFNKGNIDAISKNFINSLDNENEINRMLYAMSGHHYYLRFRMSAVYATIRELADCGQIDEAYKREDLAKIGAYFICVSHPCPLESILNTGSINLNPISIFKLFFNGAYQQILTRTLENLGLK